MSENTNRINPVDTDTMSTADLEAFLQMDMQLPDDKQSDAQTLLLIVDALEKRSDNRINAPKTNKEAFDEFQRVYLPAVNEVKNLYEDPKRPIQSVKWVRTVAVAAAVVVILLSSSITAKAMGYDLWGLVAKWTNEIFCFVDPNTEEPPMHMVEYDDLQSVLDSYGVELRLVPHWFPEGYVLETVNSSETPKSIDISAQYVCGNDRIMLGFTYHRVGAVPYLSEKDTQEVEQYILNDQVYYLFYNNSNITAVWIVDNWECSIHGPITTEEMKRIIASIYEGE